MSPTEIQGGANQTNGRLLQLHGLRACHVDAQPLSSLLLRNIPRVSGLWCRCSAYELIVLDVDGKPRRMRDSVVKDVEET